jgi:phospholipase C
MAHQMLEPSIAWDQITLSGDSPWTGIAQSALESSTVFAPSKTAWFVGYDESSGYQSQQESKTQRSGRPTASSADLTAVRRYSASGIADVDLKIRVAISSSKER